MDKVIIKWMGHSCFKVSMGKAQIVFDPFEDGYVPGYQNIRMEGNLLLCSHDHRDHGYRDAVKMIELPEEELPEVTVIDSWHDDQNGQLRGKNKIHVIEKDGFKIVHLGDLGCMPEKEQLLMMMNSDVIMVPIGGVYTINAKQAKELVDRLDPKVVIPMHYRSASFGFDVIGSLDEYTDLCNDVIYHKDNKIIITKDTEKQTAVLEVEIEGGKKYVS